MKNQLNSLLKYKKLIIFLILIIALFYYLSNLQDSKNAFASKDISSEVKLDTPFKYLINTEEIIVQLNLYQLGNQVRRDVIIKSTLKFNEDDILEEKQQTSALETQSSILIYFNVPKNYNWDKLSVEIEILDFEGNTLSKTSIKEFTIKDSFQMRESKIMKNSIILGVLLISTILIYTYMKSKRRRGGEINTIKNKIKVP